MYSTDKTDKTVTFRNRDGASVSLSIPRSYLSEEEESVLNKLLESKDLEVLSGDERQMLESKRIVLGADSGPNGPLVRFDCKWVTWRDFSDDILSAVVAPE